jgi:hypothetical protein
MKRFIVQYMKGCTICQSTKPNMVRPKIPIYPIVTAETHAYPFQTISWDLITDLPKKEGFNSVLTIIDHDCSKATLFFPCSKEIDTTGVAVLYAQQVFPHYSIPQKIILDRDPHFTATFAHTVCTQLNIKQISVQRITHKWTGNQSRPMHEWSNTCAYMVTRSRTIGSTYYQWHSTCTTHGSTQV